MNQSFSTRRFFFFPFLMFVFLLTVSPAPAVQTPPDGGCFVYPSPASGNLAWVVYNLPESGTAAISIYNEAGDLITFEQASNSSGTQQTAFDLTHYQSGVYICRVVLTLDSGGVQALKIFKFIVIK
jgi:hypothetical protein